MLCGHSFLPFWVDRVVRVVFCGKNGAVRQAENEKSLRVGGLADRWCLIN